MIDYTKFTKAQIQTLRDQYVGNECDSDEYRETQPIKGLWSICSVGLLPTEVQNIIYSYVDHLDNSMEIENIDQLIKEISEASQDAEVSNVIAWLEEAKFGSYCGADLLYPILERVFDLYVDEGEHPYFGSQLELVEWLKDMEL